MTAAQVPGWSCCTSGSKGCCEDSSLPPSHMHHAQRVALASTTPASGSWIRFSASLTCRLTWHPICSCTCACNARHSCPPCSPAFSHQPPCSRAQLSGTAAAIQQQSSGGSTCLRLSCRALSCPGCQTGACHLSQARVDLSAAAVAAAGQQRTGPHAVSCFCA